MCVLLPLTEWCAAMECWLNCGAQVKPTGKKLAQPKGYLPYIEKAWFHELAFLEGKKLAKCMWEKTNTQVRHFAEHASNWASNHSSIPGNSLTGSWKLPCRLVKGQEKKDSMHGALSPVTAIKSHHSSACSNAGLAPVVWGIPCQSHSPALFVHAKVSNEPEL